MLARNFVQTGFGLILNPVASGKAGFHMIVKIAATAGKNVQQTLRSCGNHFLAIVAITAITWKPAYMENAQRSKSRRPLGFF